MTMNTNDLNTTTILTADDFIPFEKLPSKTVIPTKGLEIKEERIYGKTYPSVNYDYWRCSVTLDLFKRFAPKFSEKVISLFGEEIVENNLGYISMHNLTTTQKIQAEYLDSTIKLTNGILIGGLQTFTITKHRGEWTKEEEVKGVNMIIPSQYSGNHEGPVMRGCMQDKYPWLKNFDCSFYGYNGDTYEFYVDVTPEEEKNKEKKQFHQTLYVDLRAITERNPQIIKDRMESYFKFFYRDNKENYERAIGALETPLGKLFLKCVAGDTTNVLEEEKIYEKQVHGCTYEYLVVFTKNNHSSVKNFHSLERAIYSLKIKINSLLEDYGQSDIEFTTDWSNASVKFIKNGLYELNLVRIVVKDINE